MFLRTLQLFTLLYIALHIPNAYALEQVGDGESHTIAFGAVAATYVLGDVTSNFTNVNKKTHFGWVNGTNVKLLGCIRENDLTNCSKIIPMPAGSSAVLDQIGFGTKISIRYASGAPASGEVIIYAW